MMNEPNGRREEISIKAIRSGDHAAFDDLFAQSAPRVRGYLLRLTGNRAEAEDLTQETFLAAYRSRDEVGRAERGVPLAWLLGIAYRRWRDGRRGREAQVRFAPLNEETQATPGTAGGNHADRVVASATLEGALDRLKPEERACLELTAVQGLTYAEAARVLGEPAGTIKWRVHEATRALRRILTAAEERYDATDTSNR